MDKNGRTPKKKKKIDGCMSIHERKWTGTQKKKKMFACPSMNKSGRTKKKKKKDGCMSVHEQKWTDTKKFFKKKN